MGKAGKSTNRPRQDFKKLINYFQSQMNWEELDEETKEIYFSGMKFFDQVVGNSAYNPLFEEDIEIMISLRGEKHYNGSELAKMHERNAESAMSKMAKLIARGYCYSYKEGKTTYYALSPRGEEYLRKEVLGLDES